RRSQGRGVLSLRSSVAVSAGVNGPWLQTTSIIVKIQAPHYWMQHQRRKYTGTPGRLKTVTSLYCTFVRPTIKICDRRRHCDALSVAGGKASVRPRKCTAQGGSPATR